jgi:hypothetical protein
MGEEHHILHLSHGLQQITNEFILMIVIFFYKIINQLFVEALKVNNITRKRNIFSV